MDSAHLEKVAKEICQADYMRKYSWNHLGQGRERYRRMAQAAIDALQLREEWASGVYNIDGVLMAPIRLFSSEDEARGSTPWPVSRLVSGWVRVDGGDQ